MRYHFVEHLVNVRGLANAVVVSHCSSPLPTPMPLSPPVALLPSCAAWQPRHPIVVAQQPLNHVEDRVQGERRNEGRKNHVEDREQGERTSEEAGSLVAYHVNIYINKDNGSLDLVEWWSEKKTQLYTLQFRGATMLTLLKKNLYRLAQF